MVAFTAHAYIECEAILSICLGLLGSISGRRCKSVSPSSQNSSFTRSYQGQH